MRIIGDDAHPAFARALAGARGQCSWRCPTRRESPGRSDDPGYATLGARLEPGRMGELVELCDRIFAAQPMQYWQRALERADVAYSIVANIDDVVADRQMAANGVFVEIDDAVLGRVRTVDTPMRIEGQPKVTRAAGISRGFPEWRTNA